jgi:hypothetical protein
MLFSNEFLRVVMDEREREVQRQLRVRRLIGRPHVTVRWVERAAHRFPGREHGRGGG